MTRANIIGGTEPQEDPRGTRKACPHCDHGFERQSLGFMLLSRGNTIRCTRCLEDSYLRPHRTAAYAIMFALGAVSLLFTVLLINGIMALATLSADGSFLIFWWIVVLSVVAGFWSWRAVLRSYNYHTGWFSDDDLYQSIMDFGR